MAGVDRPHHLLLLCPLQRVVSVRQGPLAQANSPSPVNRAQLTNRAVIPPLEAGACYTATANDTTVTTEVTQPQQQRATRHGNAETANDLCSARNFGRNPEEGSLRGAQRKRSVSGECRTPCVLLAWAYSSGLDAACLARTSFMPQVGIGQLPGLDSLTSGCIGQVYTTAGCELVVLLGIIPGAVGNHHHVGTRPPSYPPPEAEQPAPHRTPIAA